MRALSGCSIESLEAECAAANLNPGAARRVLRAFWRNDGAVNWHDLPIAHATQRWLATNYTTVHAKTLNDHASADGTRKLLVRCAERGSTECVLMPSHRADRAAACLSSQIGCAMGCDFCASTQKGLERNLSVSEIVEQFILLRRIARRQQRRIASTVFMGMGEPMHNLDAVIEAIRILAHPLLGQMGARSITVSTVGIVSGIDALANADLGVGLALSLHAPDDETRAKLVPMNRRWPVAEILAAVKRYQARMGRPCNVEYCLLADVNDTDDHARLLAERMAGFRAHVNLIPYNTIGAGLSGRVYRKPAIERTVAFLDILQSRGVVAHIRQTRGDDVAAACGQLKVLSAKPE